MKNSLTAVLTLLTLAIATTADASDQGGVTFPRVAQFIDSDGTRYMTEFSFESNTSDPYFLRFQWMPIDGESFDYTLPYNPVPQYGFNLIALYYVGIWRGEFVSGFGALRLLPVDANGNPLPGVKLTGHARLHVVTASGLQFTERYAGIPDGLAPNASAGARPGGINPFILEHPDVTETHQFTITNLDSQQHTYRVSASAAWTNGQDPKSWSWTDSLTVQPSHTGMLTMQSLPADAFEARGVDSQKTLRSIAAMTFCTDCGDASPYAAAIVSNDASSGDTRVSIDSFSER